MNGDELGHDAAVPDELSGTDGAIRAASGWGRRWIERCERSERLGPATVDLGRTYASHDRQLDLHLEPGKAETAARSGPRVRHQVIASCPTLDPGSIGSLLELIASSGTQTAALFDRELEPDLLDRAAEIGIDLLPRPDEVRLDCGCSQRHGVCKHRAALAVLLGEAFDEDPFALLLLRGLAHADLVAGVESIRRGDRPGEPVDASTAGSPIDGGTPGSSEGREPTPSVPTTLAEAWRAAPGPLPPPLSSGATTAVPTWGNPPDNAPFTADGLHELVADAMDRAVRLESGGSTGLDDGVEADLARRFARLEASGDAEGIRRLARLAGISTLEARTRGRAWAVADAPGVEAVAHPEQVERLDADHSVRRIADGRWFLFVKQSGRWQLEAGPFAEPPEVPAQDSPTQDNPTQDNTTRDNRAAAGPIRTEQANRDRSS